MNKFENIINKFAIICKLKNNNLSIKKHKHINIKSSLYKNNNIKTNIDIYSGNMIIVQMYIYKDNKIKIDIDSCVVNDIFCYIYDLPISITTYDENLLKNILNKLYINNNAYIIQEV